MTDGQDAVVQPEKEQKKLTLTEPIEKTVDKANLAWVLPKWDEAFDLYKSIEHRVTGHLLGHVNYRLGQLYHRRFGDKEPEEAEKYFEVAHELVPIGAAEDDPESLCNLGHMYENGNTFPQDHVEAIKYYQMAADLKFPRGQYNLAVMLQHKDKKLAIQYYEYAAAQAYPCAHYNLGIIYWRDKDYKKAIIHYLAAAEIGDIEAQGHVAKMFNHDSQDIRYAAVSYLAHQWPNLHFKLAKECQMVIQELFLVSQFFSHTIPRELRELIVKDLIILWPRSHYNND